jgi:hypothetical protein
LRAFQIALSPRSIRVRSREASSADRGLFSSVSASNSISFAYAQSASGICVPLELSPGNRSDSRRPTQLDHRKQLKQQLSGGIKAVVSEILLFKIPHKGILLILKRVLQPI